MLSTRDMDRSWAFLLWCVFGFFPLLVGTDGAYQKAARQLESLTTHTSGVLNDLPEEIRARRVGQVQQKVTVTNDGVIKVHRSFSCKPQLCVESQPKLFEASGDHCIVLSELRKGRRYRIEPHRHEGFVRIVECGAGWSIDVSKPTEVDSVASLIATLAEKSADTKASPSSLPSEMARAAGFRYLVVAPRCEDVADTVHVLTHSEPSPNMGAYLTKLSPDAIEKVLHESFNRLPLFFFQLETLDTGTFYTQSIPGANFFTSYSLDAQTPQSVVSTEGEKLQSFFTKSAHVGICCTSMFDLSKPVQVLCRPCDQHALQKAAKSSQVTVAKRGWTLCDPLELFPSPPHGTTSNWIEGINDNSDDVLRYCLLDKPLTPNLVRYMLYTEIPDLRSLLKMTSCYGKGRSIEETICLSSQTLHKRAGTFSPEMLKVLRIALFTHELGAPFGSEAEVEYNSWPIALAVGERMGFSEGQKQALRTLIATSPVALVRKKTFKESLLQTLVLESEVANGVGTSLGEWLDMKRCFVKILTNQFRSTPRVEGLLRTIDGVQRKCSSLLPFGLPGGTRFMRGPYETRGPYSSYIWEMRDHLHRDGLSLKRRREKFERMIVDNGKSVLKGRFWNWLDKETKGQIAPCLYLRPQDREAYLARFENGLLVHPALSSKSGDVETMFVVDEWGRLYIGIKKDGTGKQDLGFNHASFMHGGSVASAGKLTFRSGKAILITDHSGHYRCGAKEIQVALKVLESMGVAIDDIEVHVGSGRSCDKQQWSSGKAFTSRSTASS
jgi:hypothetical protein